MNSVWLPASRLAEFTTGQHEAGTETPILQPKAEWSTPGRLGDNGWIWRHTSGSAGTLVSLNLMSSDDSWESSKPSRLASMMPVLFSADLCWSFYLECSSFHFCLALWLTPPPKPSPWAPPQFLGPEFISLVHFFIVASPTFFYLPHILILPGALSYTEQTGEMLTASNWIDAVLIRSQVSRLCFPLGITSLTLPSKSNQGRIISKEKPNLFISNFLPFGCQMETGQDISSSSLLQQPYFPSWSWTSAGVCKISPLSETIFFLVLSNSNKLLAICLFPENQTSWFWWLLPIHNPADF